jgi:CRISPR/Cas system-associated endoribonuclease Cas2
MLIAIAGQGPSRLMVVAYDIGSPRRARKVRRVLDAVNHAKQYSVYETVLGPGELRRVLTEVRACCDPQSDRLAVWWPVGGARLVWSQNGLQSEALAGGNGGRPAHLSANIGNFMLCFDISDAAALRAVSAEIAAETAMVQRSVYWLRAPVAYLTALLKRCSALLETGDRLWAYPLGASRALWRMGEDTAPSLLPISTHHW